MKRWAWLLWLPVYIASEFILLGSHNRPGLIAAGGALILIAFLTALWLVLRPDGHPRPPWFYWAIGGVFLCYVPPAIAASTLGTEWLIGALSASLIPMTAVTLALAVVRGKTVVTDSGLRDEAGDRDDPTPGIGMDDKTPFGDTDQHSEVIEDERSGMLGDAGARARRQHIRAR